jgi:chromosome segregation ATPase
MTIPSVVQGLIETEDGKVFELNSPKGEAWVEAIGSFRFEPAGDGKAYTVRREPSGYWYGCRKIAGKVRKKYIGKSSEVSMAKLEEIAAALEIPPVPRVSQVAEVAQKVAEVAEVAQKVAEDRLTTLELEVADLRKALEALQEALPGKLNSGDFAELPKTNNEVAEELRNKLSNLKIENELLRQQLAERNEKIELLKQELAENTRYYTARLNEAGATVSTFKDKLEAAQAKNQRLQNELRNLQVEGEELAQLKKEAKEAAAEVHREGRSIELEKVRWQRELSDARGELADAKATMLNQSNKIRELERGYSLGPNPAERRLRLEIGELQAQISSLKQKPAAASRDLPEAAEILNQLKSKRKKSKADLVDMEVILEILEN